MIPAEINLPPRLCATADSRCNRPGRTKDDTTRGRSVNDMSENPGADRIADLLETRISGDARRTLSDLARNARRGTAQTHILDELDEAPEVVLLFDGWVSLYKTLGEGHNQIVDFAIPLEIVHPASADGHTATFSMQAVTDSTVLTLKAARWDQLLAGDRGLARLDAVLSRAARSRVSERMLRLGQANAKTCVAYALIELCLRLGARGPDGRVRLSPADHAAETW